MPSIIKKNLKGKIYYYYVESKRIDGKPRHVNQKYLGTAETIFEKFSQTSELKDPLYSIILEFADVCLLYDIASRLNVIGIINKYATKRNQGVSVGEYALIAAINRATLPTTKNCIASWYEKTVLSRLFLVKPSALIPQNYWNHMDISDEVLCSIEDELVKKIVDQYQIDTSRIIYDATNFYTYIDTMQNSELAKRGHCKSKRNDLKIVSLSMMITPDCNIPLLYDTYPGNRPDSKQFTVMLNKLKNRYERITSKKADVTVVFDRGNNSQDNIDLLECDEFPLYYVGGLKRNQCYDLYELDTEAFLPLVGDDFDNDTAFRATREIYNREMTVVVVFNPNLYDGQLQGILLNIEKTATKFNELQTKLINRAEGIVTKGRTPTQASVEKQIKTVLATEFMKDIFGYELSTYNAIPFFSYNLDVSKLDNIKKTVLGKTVLFTNRHDWSNEEITTAYRSAWRIEHAFKQMKDTDHLTVRPLYHRTDQKIKVHIFYCILAYRLCCLLKKELQAFGISDSVNHILEQLQTIKYVITVLGTSSSDISCSFSKGTALAESISSLYSLKEKFQPNLTC